MTSVKEIRMTSVILTEKRYNTTLHFFDECQRCQIAQGDVASSKDVRP